MNRKIVNRAFLVAAPARNHGNARAMAHARTELLRHIMPDGKIYRARQSDWLI